MITLLLSISLLLRTTSPKKEITFQILKGVYNNVVTFAISFFVVLTCLELLEYINIWLQIIVILVFLSLSLFISYKIISIEGEYVTERFVVLLTILFMSIFVNTDLDTDFNFHILKNPQFEEVYDGDNFTNWGYTLKHNEYIYYHRLERDYTSTRVYNIETEQSVGLSDVSNLNLEYASIEGFALYEDNVYFYTKGKIYLFDGFSYEEISLSGSSFGDPDEPVLLYVDNNQLIYYNSRDFYTIVGDTATKIVSPIDTSQPDDFRLYTFDLILYETAYDHITVNDVRYDTLYFGPYLYGSFRQTYIYNDKLIRLSNGYLYDGELYEQETSIYSAFEFEDKLYFIDKQSRSDLLSIYDAETNELVSIIKYIDSDHVPIGNSDEVIFGVNGPISDKPFRHLKLNGFNGYTIYTNLTYQYYPKFLTGFFISLGISFMLVMSVITKEKD